MGKMSKSMNDLADYLIDVMRWGEDSIAIGLCCNSEDLAREMLAYLKAHPDIAWDEALGKAVEFHEKKYGKQTFVVVDDEE